MKKTISTVIFDCDGVMFDSRQANINYYNSLLLHFNLPDMEKKDVSLIHMFTAEDSVKYLFRDTPYLDMALEYRLDIDYTPFIYDMVMEPGLREILEILKPRFGLAIATNRSNTIGKVLEIHGINEFFDIVVSSLDVKKPKPHPETIYKIQDFFCTTSDECIYIGDSVVDYEVCKASGVTFISYKNKSLLADYHIDHLLDIQKIIC